MTGFSNDFYLFRLACFLSHERRYFKGLHVPLAGISQTIFHQKNVEIQEIKQGRGFFIFHGGDLSKIFFFLKFLAWDKSWNTSSDFATISEDWAILKNKLVDKCCV